MTATPDDLVRALNFTAQRFVATATELDKARAKLGLRCTCGGRPDEIGGAEHRPGCGEQ